MKGFLKSCFGFTGNLGDLWWEFLWGFRVDVLLPKTTSFVDPNRRKNHKESLQKFPRQFPQKFSNIPAEFGEFSKRFPQNPLAEFTAGKCGRYVPFGVDVTGQWPKCTTHPSHPIPISISLSRSTDLIIRINDLNMILNCHLNPQDELCKNGCNNTMPTKR